LSHHRDGSRGEEEESAQTSDEVKRGTCIGELMYWKIIQEDHEFIVTRATTAIALHLLHTIHPAAPQSVWVLTTHATYSTTYRRSGYAPGFTDKQNEHKQKPKQQRKPKTSTTPSLNKGKLNNNRV
jgi:hypothetical protein